MKKRLLSLALCLALCLGLFPFGVLAEETNGDDSPAEASVVSLTAGSETTSYASLEEAVTAANSLTVPTATITVLEDTEMQKDAEYKNSNTLLTLDLNGKNVTAVAGAYFLLSSDKGAEAVIQDSSKEQTGAIKLVQVEETNTLTVESGNIDTLYVGCGTYLTIHGGTIRVLTFRQKGKCTLNMTDGYVQSLADLFDGTSIYATLSGGKFDSIRCKSSRKDWLAKGYAFQKDGSWITPAAADATTQIENITVKKCEHADRDEKQVCLYCGQAECVAEMNGMQYETLKEALKAADSSTEDTVTVKVLQDTQLTESYYYSSRTKLILDLNGKRVESVANNGNFAYLVLQSESGAKAEITDSSADETGYIQSVQADKGTEVIVNGGYIDTLYVCGSTVTVGGGTINQLGFKAGGDQLRSNMTVTDGRIRYLSAYGSAKVTGIVSGGTFDKVAYYGKEDWLVPGYAYKQNGNWVKRMGTNETSEMDNLTVEKCEHANLTEGVCDYCGAKSAECQHNNVSETGKCTDCGYQYALKLYDPDTGKTSFYNVFSDGTNGAFYKLPASGGTITLLQNVEMKQGYATKPKSFTLDLQNFRLYIPNNTTTSSLTVTLCGAENSRIEGEQLVVRTLVLSENFKGTIKNISKLTSPVTVEPGCTGTVETLTVYRSSALAKHVSLAGGSFNNIIIDFDAGFSNPTLGDLLAEGYRFETAAGESLNYDYTFTQNNKSIENVKVVPCEDHAYENGFCKYCNHTCETHTWASGKCVVCGLVCQHTNVTEIDGVYTCFDCEQQMQAKISEKHYTTLNDAISAAVNGDIIIMLQDVSTSAMFNQDKSLTLNLNDHSLSTLYVTRSGKLALTGGGSVNDITVSNELDLSRWNGSVTHVLQVEYTGKLTVGSQVDSIWLLSLYRDLTSLENIKLSGGTYTTINSNNPDFNIIPSKMLATGYALQYSYYPYESIDYNAELRYEVKSVRVVKCISHADSNHDGYCDYCNTSASTFVASVTKGEAITYYTTIEYALDAASNGDTVTLLAGAGTIEISSPIILDLNGKNVTSLTASTGAKIKDSSETKGVIGTLTVNGDKLADLLAEGYAIADSDNTIQNGYTNSTASNVTIISHQHEWNNSSCVCGLVCNHAGKWKNGKCTVCNYACPHNAGATEAAGVYTCNTCGQTVTAKLVAPDGKTTTYYADGFLGDNQKSGLYFAINAAESGSTLTVLGGKSQSGFVKGSKTLTLDVSNGKAVNGTLNVGYNDTKNKLIIIGNANIEGIIVDPNNTLDLTDWTGSINSMTVKNGATATLKSGTFAVLNINGQKAGSLLASGYAFQQVEGGAYVSYSSTANMKNVKVVKCPHTSVTNGICDYCNTSGFVATVKHGDVTSIYHDFNKALEAAASGDTVTLLADADALDINKNIKLDANGKTISKLTVGDGVTLSDLLPEGYAYKSGGTWVSDLSVSSLESVTMAMAPIQSLNYQDSFSIVYGTVDSIVVNAILANGVTGTVTYQWYKVKDGEAESIAGATGNSFALNAPMLPVGTHTFRCFATCNDYTMKSSDIVVTVTKSDIISAAITRPTAIENLIYTGNAQELIQPGNATDGTMQYSTEQNGTYSTAIPTGKNAGEYTVWYMVKGDANHNDTEPASINITISKADPTYKIPSDLIAIYGQTLANVTLPDDWKWTDSTQSVGPVSDQPTSFKATYTPSDTENYNTVTDIAVPVTVTPASYQATVSMTGYTYGETPSTPSVSPNPEKGTVTYYYSTTNTNHGGTVWTADTQLNAGTYYLYAVIGETTNYQAVTTPAVSFTVSSKSLADAVVTLGDALTYNGNAQSPNVTVTLGNKELTVTTDYTLTGNSGTNADSYTLTVTGKGNYAGEVQKVWKIEPKNISGAEITLGNALTYTGDALTQTVSKVLIDDLEATYDVSGNVQTNAGPYTLTVSGNGNFTGTATAGFTISKAEQAITAADISATYGDTDKDVDERGTVGTVTYKSSDEAAVTVDKDGKLTFLKSGTATITISAAGNDNYKAGSKSITVTIAKKALTIKANDKSAYVGSTAPDLTTVTEKDYTVTGLVGEDTLKDITVKLAYKETPDMTKPGTCAIQVTVEGTDDRYSFTTEDGTLTITTRPSSGGSGITGTKTDTVKNPDGSTTKTETKSDGSKTETTTATTPGGSTGSTVTKTDTKGNSKTEASAKLSDKDVKDAQEKGEAVTVPVKDIEAGKDSNSATEIKIDLPKNSGKTTVEIPVDNVTSGTVAVIVHPDGTEEIAKSSKPTEDGVQLEIDSSTTVKIIDNSKDFIDTRDHWSRDEVNFVAARELFNGVGDNRFGVSQPMTRGMVNTVLARLSGVDTTPGQGQTWYEIGTEWAKKNGISDGTNPTSNVTREQLATLLYRYAGSPDVSGTLSFADANSVSDYAKNALLWANQNGIVNGIGSNTIAPKSNAERAQVAAMFARYLKTMP